MSSLPSAHGPDRLASSVLPVHRADLEGLQPQLLEVRPRRSLGQWSRGHAGPLGAPRASAARRAGGLSGKKSRTTEVLKCSWSVMIEPTSLNAVPEVGVASMFEDFFLAEHERLFKSALPADR